MPEFDDPRDAAYAAMQTAFLQTERGRWFLAEYARRNRAADTAQVLAAIDELGARIGVAPAPHAAAPPVADPLPAILAGIFAQAEAEDAAASTALPAATVSHAAAILDAAEQVQEVAWTLREAGHDGAACDLLDQRASDIYAACAALDPLLRDAAALRERVTRLETRLARIRDAALSPPTPEPGQEGETQDAESASFLRDEAELQRQQLAILADIDKLGLHEKLRLFT